jgi:hypothetical protein
MATIHTITMSLLIFVASLVLAVLSLWGIRWAITAFIGVGLLIAASCGRSDTRSDDTVPTSLPRDTMPPDIQPYGEMDADSLRQRIDSLDDALSGAGEADRPRLLFETGRAKRLFVADRGTPHGNYAARREDEFFYNEVGGNYLYNGKDLKALIERYPQHDLADDAGYELTLLPGGGECEGFVTCYIAQEWHDLDPFLRRFPTSAYASRAVERVVRSYRNALKDVPNLTTPTDMYDPKELRPLLASLDSVAIKLPAALKARTDSLSQSVWAKLGGKP